MPDVASLSAARSRPDRHGPAVKQAERAVYNLDRDLRFLSANDRALSLWGKRAEEVIGRALGEVFPEAMGSEGWEAHVVALKSLRPFRKIMQSRVLQAPIELEIHPSAKGLSVSFLRLEPER